MKMVRIIPFEQPRKKFEQIIREELFEDTKDDKFAQKLYAALCNTVWYNKSTNDIYSCSWRYAGGIVASIRDNNEDYLDFYCSGGEGRVHNQISKKLNKLGYEEIGYNNIEFLSENNFE